MIEKSFLISPEMHRARAAELRELGTPSSLALALHYEALARAIEKRLNGPPVIAAPPIDPV